MANLTLKLNRAVSAYKAGKLIEAEQLCQQIITAKHNFFDALHVLAVVQSRLGKKEEALASYDCALKVRPDYAEALFNRGNTLTALMRFDEALASYDRALKVRPDFAEALSARGNTLRELKRLDEALASQAPTFARLDLKLSRLRPCRYGLMVFLATDKIIGRALDLYGEFAESENRVFARLIKPGDVVVDVGANIGAVALALAHFVGPSGRVYAFEPQRIIFQHLCANAVLNGFTNIDARCAAVGGASGSACIPALDPATTMNFGEVKLSTGMEGDIVPVVTLDGLGLTTCGLIKIDVEGMEPDVLRGAERTIAEHRPFVYFEAEIKSGEKTPYCISWLFERNYRLYWHFVPFFRKENFRAFETNVFGDYGDINVLAIAGGSQVQVSLPPIESPCADWQVDCRAWFDGQKGTFRD